MEGRVIKIEILSFLSIMHHLADYHPDIIPLIFRQLSSKHRLRSTQVCKSWQATLIKVSKMIANEYRDGSTDNITLAIQHKDYHIWMIDNLDLRIDSFDTNYETFRLACHRGCIRLVKRISSCFESQGNMLADVYSMLDVIMLEQACELNHYKIVILFIDSIIANYDDIETNTWCIIDCIYYACKHDRLLTALSLSLVYQKYCEYNWSDILKIAHEVGSARIISIAEQYVEAGVQVITTDHIDEIKILERERKSSGP